MPLYAKSYIFLRDIVAPVNDIVVQNKPETVALLLTTEFLFVKDPLLLHHKTVFFEDELHDWSWHSSRFNYHGTASLSASTLVLIYETVRIPVYRNPNFCMHCGKPYPCGTKH
jgi:hypothetical protein